jgi:hypothetical protein
MKILPIFFETYQRLSLKKLANQMPMDGSAKKN